MFSKTSFSIFIVGIFVFGFAFLSQPQSASAGAAATGLGCCITNGNQCNPNCGFQGQSCQRDFGLFGNSPCPTDESGSGSCGGINPTNKGCFIEGFTCFQVENNVGECQEAGGGGECQEPANCPVSNDTTCFDRTCDQAGNCGFVGTGDPSCERADPTGPITIIPTMGQWGMLLAAVVLGIFAIIRLRSIKDSELS